LAPNLTIEGRESGELGSRLHRCGPFVLRRHFFKHEAGEAIPLLVHGCIPPLHDVRQQAAEVDEVRILAVLAGLKCRKLALQLLAPGHR
jgi:hypothetical protein